MSWICVCYVHVLKHAQAASEDQLITGRRTGRLNLSAALHTELYVEIVLLRLMLYTQ